MRHFLASLVLILSTSSLGSTAFAEAGGITAGGGGSTNPNPVGHDLIWRAVSDSKFVLQAYLNQQDHWWHNVILQNGHEDDELQFLFDRPDDVFQYLNRLVIDVKTKSPCRDLNGNETDGSVHSKTPGAICISAFTLGKKLNEFNFEYEVPALILHEIVHQMGGNETKAIKIQTSAVYGLFKKSTLDMRVDYSMFAKHLGETSRTLNMMANAALSPNPLYPYYQRVSDDLLHMRDDFAKGWKVHPLGRLEREKFEAQLIKLMVEESYACTVAPESVDEVKDLCRERYLKGFAGKNKVTLQEYFKNQNGLEHERYAGETVTLITDRAAHKSELLAIIKVLDQTMLAVGALDKVYFRQVRID